MSVDILILSNAPGEVTTWVRPVVQALRDELGQQPRISVILSPCPNASGKEAAIAQSYPQVDRVQAAQHFWKFLVWGKTAENWDWHAQGVVLFLGGDQVFPVIIGKRLGYRTVVYAEWEARWHRWIDHFGIMKPESITHVPQKYAHKFTVVGDLMAEVSSHASFVTDTKQTTPLIGLLPGSKPAKLAQGVPLSLAIAQHISNQKPQTRFVAFVAPTLDLTTLARFANPEANPLVAQLGNVSAQLIEHAPTPLLKTNAGLCVELETRSPAYDLLSQCSLCLTTVGANTAELGALAVPMIVLLPTHQLDAMRSWDGLPGILANLPVVGTNIAKAINWLVLQRLGLLAWPNIWARTQIVPELVGKLEPQSVAELVIDYLNHPEKLAAMRSQLRSIRGKPGAAQKIAQIVSQQLDAIS